MIRRSVLDLAALAALVPIALVAAVAVLAPLDLDVLASWSPSRWWSRWSPCSSPARRLDPANHRTLATGGPCERATASTTRAVSGSGCGVAVMPTRARLAVAVAPRCWTSSGADARRPEARHAR